MKAVLLGAVLTLLSSASSAVVYSDGAGAFSVNRGRHIPRSTSRHVRDTEHLSDFRIRSAPEEIGNIDLAGTIDPGLALSVSEGAKLPGGIISTGTIKASCGSCFTTGTGHVTTDGVSFDNSGFSNPITAAIDFLKDPAKLIQDSFNVEMNFDLSNFTGHFEFEIDFTGNGVYDISIPLPPTPVGGKFPNPPLPAPAPAATVGLVPTIDIIFSVTGTVSMAMGFEFKFPKNAFFKIDPIHGNLVETNFGDVQFNPLPFKVLSGSGTASASLRLGAKLAFDFNAFGQGFTLESGLFADVPTYSTSIVFDPKAKCELDFTETLLVDAGAFASAAATVEGIAVAAGPKTVTTFATLSLPGACLASSTMAPVATTELRNATTTVTVHGDCMASSTPPPYPSTGSRNATIATSVAVATIAASTSYYVPSSLATPIMGAYIVGTPVVAAMHSS